MGDFGTVSSIEPARENAIPSIVGEKRTRKPWVARVNKVYARETRIGACADYLLGIKLKAIELKWGIPINSGLVLYWIKKTGHFKTRNRVSGQV